MKCPRCQRDIVAPVGFHWECDSCGWVGPNLDMRNSVRRTLRPAYIRPNDVSDRRYAFVAMLMDPPEMTELTLRVAAPNTDAITLDYFLDKSVRMWPVAADMVRSELQRIAREAR